VLDSCTLNELDRARPAALSSAELIARPDDSFCPKDCSRVSEADWAASKPLGVEELMAFMATSQRTAG